MHTAQKLLSDKGEATTHHLNVSLLLGQWMKDNGHVLLGMFLAWKGSRFNWHMESSSVFLLNLPWLLTFVMKVLVAVNEPNKLVVRTFEFLSCKYTVGALAARAISFLEILAPLRFLHKNLCGRWDVHTIGLQAIDSLSKGLPRGHFKNKMASFRDNYGWGEKCVKWVESQSEHAELVYSAAEPYADIWKAYHKQCLPAMAAALQRHLDPDDNGEVLMQEAFVNTSFLESNFGRLQQRNEASQKCDIWANFGQVQCDSSGLFLSCGERYVMH